MGSLRISSGASPAALKTRESQYAALRAKGKAQAQNSKQARLAKIPTATGGIARIAHSWALSQKIDPKPLLEKSGLTIQHVKNTGARIGVRNQIEFLNRVAGASEDEFLGFHLAQRFDLRELGLLYYVPASSDTFGSALRKLARYSSINNEGVRITCRRGSGLSVTFEYIDTARRNDLHQIEFFVVTLLRIGRQLLNRHLVPTGVKLVHRRTKVPADLKTFFGCNVAFGSSADEITYPMKADRMPLVGADPHLNALLIQYCEQAIAGRRAVSRSWRVKVENAIAPLLPHGEARMPEVARCLGASQRTLARRLRAEETTFANILDDLRFDLAKRYLQEGDLPMSEIAWLLGYSEVSAFHHALKRWTGATVSDFRALVQKA
jgi:AraC-like DNA-binding protein